MCEHKHHGRIDFLGIFEGALCESTFESTLESIFASIFEGLFDRNRKFIIITLTLFQSIEHFGISSEMTPLTRNGFFVKQNQAVYLSIVSKQIPRMTPGRDP